MKPNQYVQKLREYPLVSHAAWNRKKTTGILKLDWNEADVALPRSIARSLVQFIEHGPTQWYPDIHNHHLIQAIASYIGAPEASVQYFGGADAALDYLVRTFASAGDEVVLAAPTYDNFRVYVESVGAKAKQVIPLDIFAPDINALIQSISPKTRLVYLVNPNNPTGVMYDSKDIRRLVRRFPRVMFIVDEAYAEFSGVTAAPLAHRQDNLVVVRSFSKAFGLASFRIGYIIASSENIAHINKIRNGKNVPMLAQIAAIAALKNRRYMHKYVKETRQAIRFACRELEKMGFTVRPTRANFILLKVKDAVHFQKVLAQHDVFVRNLSHLPRMEKYVRVTLGSMRTARLFTAILKKVKHDLT